MNAKSRKRLFQDALFFDGFAFRHRERTKKSDFSFFFSGAALSLHVRSKSLGCQTAQIGTGMHRHCFPSAIAIGMCASARDEVGSVASGMVQVQEKRPVA